MVNQFDKRDGLSLTDIEKTLDVEVLGTVPMDRKTALQSINRGIPTALQRSRSPLRKAYKDLARDLVDLVQQGGQGPGGQQSDVLSKSSRLG